MIHQSKSRTIDLSSAGTELTATGVSKSAGSMSCEPNPRTLGQVTGFGINAVVGRGGGLPHSIDWFCEN